jgi:AAA domain
LRNAAIALACGGEFSPFVKKGEPQKVWLIDFESSAFRLQQDLCRMSRILTPEELSLVNNNLHITSEATVGDAMLNLSQHLNRIELEAKAFGFSVIFIDTVSAGFDFYNENDNAEISRRALKPLLAMARKLNCLIIIAHHVGKAKLEGGETSDRVHRGRGASAFAQYAGAIFEIQPDTSDKDAVKLYCSKRKNGEPYEVVLKLNRADRWFSCLTQLQRTPSNYELVVEYVTKQEQPVKTSQVQTGLSGKVSRATVTRQLDIAVRRGDLAKLAHGEYAAPDDKAQKLTPISDEPLSLIPETQFVEGVL